MSDQSIIPAERIERAILLIREQKVMLDADLALLYGVATSNLNKAVKRNKERFPQDFMFQLTQEQFRDLRFQCGISSRWGGRRTLPYVFTQEGVAMLSSVLRSERAIQANIAIMRALVQLRQMLASHEQLAKRLDELEQRYDVSFKVVFDAIRQLTTPPSSPKGRIGFHTNQ